MTRTDAPHHTARARMLAAALCIALSGCVGVFTRHSNDLPGAAEEDTLAASGTDMHPIQPSGAPPVALAFIIHPPLPDPRDDDARTLNRRETAAWAAALAGYAEPRHIYIAFTKNPNNMPGEMREFCRTHPVVDISGGDDPARPGAAQAFHNAGAVVLDMASLGLLQLPYTTPYVAHFRLILPPQPADAMPGSAAPSAGQADAAHVDTRDYAYTRSTTVAQLYLLPEHDSLVGLFILPIPYTNCCAEFFNDDVSDWRTREKRRLIAQFLREVRPQLERSAQHPQPASPAPPGAGSGAPAAGK